MLEDIPKNKIPKFDPRKKFLEVLGKRIEKYFGKEQSCIIYLLPDGIFYGQALYKWFRSKKKNITITAMDDDGGGLEEKKTMGRKVLIIDNDIVTGKGYKRSMEAIRLRKERLKIKDIKFATFIDRTGLADFSVLGYSVYAPWSLERLDGIDLKIIQTLFQNGRKPFVEIAKKTGLSPVSVKNRVERLLQEGILKIQGLLNMEKVYSVSAHVEIEADQGTISKLIERFEKSPVVYHLVRGSGRYNLIVSIVSVNLEGIEAFIDEEIRREPGVKHIEVNVGELPIIPKTWNPPVF